MLRTHNCNELRLSDIEKKVVLTGWVDTVRDHGGVLFLDLRDHYGITQVVISDDKMLENVCKETVILVKGTVCKRDEETINQKIATGDVELKAEQLEILGPCQLALPFEISSSTVTREDVRLKYRFLDLRNRKIHDNIVLRSQIISYLRKQMEELGLKERGLNRLVKASYRLLGLISYLTTGEDETRAWTIKVGTKAPQAAGKIHSDFERGFIRAEVVSFDDLMECGSLNAAKEKGLVRSEGKEYVMNDGDVVLFRFNV